MIYELNQSRRDTMQKVEIVFISQQKPCSIFRRPKAVWKLRMKLKYMQWLDAKSHFLYILLLWLIFLEEVWKPFIFFCPLLNCASDDESTAWCLIPCKFSVLCIVSLVSRRDWLWKPSNFKGISFCLKKFKFSKLKRERED